MIGHDLALILLGWAVAAGSPGPATLAISGTAMDRGRAAGLAIAAGVGCGSAAWGVAAAMGMSAIMLAHAWLFELVRYIGAAYLMFLAVKAFRRVLHPPPAVPLRPTGALRRLWGKGILLHLTNPKAILSWGAIYAIALPAGAQMAQIWQLFAMLISVSLLVFFGYGVLFSSARIARRYLRLRRVLDGVFAALFGAASLKILTLKLDI